MSNIIYLDSVTATLSGSATQEWEPGRVVSFDGSVVSYAATSGTLPTGVLFASGIGGDPGRIVIAGGTILCDASGSVNAGYVGAAGDGTGKVVNVSADYAIGRCFDASTNGKIRVLVDVTKLS